MTESGNTTALLEEIARCHAYWVSVAAEALCEPRDLGWSDSPEAYRIIAGALRQHGCGAEIRVTMEELMRGLVHSLLVILDGGTDLARQVTLTVQANGESVPAGIHELWVGHLIDSGRLKS
jgi:hypothetical protein